MLLGWQRGGKVALKKKKFREALKLGKNILKKRLTFLLQFLRERYNFTDYILLLMNSKWY